MVVWGGTWRFSADEILQATLHVRDKLLMLGSAKNIADYERIRPWVDGDAYYWSSVNPATNTRYQGKLDGMAAAVHARSGIWIAPAAPGFDARLIGGDKAVPRNDGDTLRREFAAAENSSPDAIGLISWNEFSENTHVEPSKTYGGQSLTALAKILDGRAPQVGGLDSDAPADPAAGIAYGLPVLVGFVIALPLVVLLIRRRLRRIHRIGIEHVDPTLRPRPGRARPGRGFQGRSCREAAGRVRFAVPHRASFTASCRRTPRRSACRTRGLPCSHRRPPVPPA